MLNLRIQLSYFKEVEKLLRKKLRSEEAKMLLMKAVYLFSIGGNDYRAMASYLPHSLKIQYVATVIRNLTLALEVSIALITVLIYSFSFFLFQNFQSFLLKMGRR